MSFFHRTSIFAERLEEGEEEQTLEINVLGSLLDNESMDTLVIPGDDAEILDPDLLLDNEDMDTFTNPT